MLNYALASLITIIIVIVIIRRVYGTKKLFKDELNNRFKALEGRTNDFIVEEDLVGLPELLQEYLRVTRVVGSQKVNYFHVEMKGEMKMDENKSFAPVKVEQFTFLESGTRLFYMTMNFKGIPISGIHNYHSKGAMMKVKVLDLIEVVHEAGKEMQRIETVTYFNDLCIMAPGGLIEEDIMWEEIDERSVKGTLRKHGHEVSATLYFNNDGMLDNFISEDRVKLNSEDFQNKVLWSTPMTKFSNIGDFHLASEGSAIWHYPANNFEYIRLKIEDVTINNH